MSTSTTTGCHKTETTFLSMFMVPQPDRASGRAQERRPKWQHAGGTCPPGSYADRRREIGLGLDEA
jgi:hypothetical protein